MLISNNVLFIAGTNKSYFPSGNALIIKTQKRLMLFDTSPGSQLIEKALKEQWGKTLSDITDIFLSHIHFDHSHSLAKIFKKTNRTAKIYSSPFTLKRMHDIKNVCVFAGIPPSGFHHMIGFGESLGFENHEYPSQIKAPLEHLNLLTFDEKNITILPIESHGHCPNYFAFEIIDGDTKIMFSGDYDFTPVPWYGSTQRGDAIELFIEATKELVARDPDILVSSHRSTPILKKDLPQELKKFLDGIQYRTTKLINSMGVAPMTLKDIPNLVYPIDKMIQMSGESGKFSDDYIYLATLWDVLMRLSHLEHAWKLGLAKCIDAKGDEHLEKCIKAGKYLPRTGDAYLGLDWARETLEQTPEFLESLENKFPMQSKWIRI